MLTNGKKLDGRYVIHQKIGSGGFGAVYLAQDTRFSGNNRVAIKKILQTGEQFSKSFRREADLLYNLSHPNLPKVTDCFQEDGANFIVMDYVSGDDLAVCLRNGKNFTVEEVLLIADKVLDALEYLHSFTIFHRDIKPHNIKVDTNGKIFLLDFGTAKGNFDETTVTHQTGQSVTGYTPFYAPLEQVLRVDPNSYFLLQSLDSSKMEDFLNQKTDARSDIYSLGASLYHLLTRLSPEKATSTIRAHAIWSGNPDTLQPIQNFNAEVSNNLAEVIRRSVEIEPEKRFQTAAEFRKALNDLQNENMSAETISLSNITIEPAVTRKVQTANNFFNAENTASDTSDLNFEKTTQPKSKTALYLGILAIFLVLGSGTILLGWWIWASTETAKVPETGRNNLTNSPKAHSLSYSLLVQKMRDGKEFQEPFESSGQEIFENGYKFQMRFTPSENGFFYIFAEGLDDKNEKTFNIIFPTPDKNGGKPEVTANRQYETSWNQFSGTAGTENFWIIFNKNLPDIAERSREDAFRNQGKLTDKSLTGDLKNYLENGQKDKPNISKDAVKSLSKIEFANDEVIFLLQLEHR